MMIDINDYMMLPQSDRQAHLKLDEPCIERGSSHSYLYKGLLAYYFDTSIPTGMNILVCHACHNSQCGNIHHLYWGTSQENSFDRIANGGHRSPYHANVAKLGLEEANRKNTRTKEHMSKLGSSGGKKQKSEAHKKAISESIKKYYENKKQV